MELCKGDWPLMFGTDPTYKEWKPIGLTALRRVGVSHGSYLQGMETSFKRPYYMVIVRHGSYLQGMETKTRGRYYHLITIRTDPTYKEWKPTDTEPN